MAAASLGRLHCQHTVAGACALHGPRIGLALHADAPTAGWFRSEDAAPPSSAADYLRLVSSLWDSWPLDALIGDTEGGR